MAANPSCSTGACDMIRFQVLSADSTTRSALVQILGRPYGCGQNDLPGTDLGGTVAEVCDPAGCFFNEPDDQLIGRQGWARYIQPLTSTPCQPYQYNLVPEWEVFSLCCAVNDCTF